MTPSFDAELAVRRHGRALHSLAAAMLADGNAADDVVADTWAGALQRPPRHASAVGGWLRVAAQNLAALAPAFGIGGEVGAVAMATGAVLMGTTAKVSAGVAAVAMVAVLWWWARNPEPLTLPIAHGGALPAVGAPLDVADTPGAKATLDRRRIDVVSAGSTDPSENAQVRGRVVASESGAPLAGCSVKLMHGSNVEVLTTGADGSFGFSWRADRASLDLTIWMGDRAQAHWSSTALAPGQCEDLGDVALRRGGIVRGRVVDERDRPVADVVLVVWNVPNGLRPGSADKAIIGAKSDANGGFEFESALPAGAWQLDCMSGRSVVSPQSVLVDADRALAPITVRTALPARIDGIAVHDAGVAVAGAIIAAEGAAAEARTHADGRFTLLAAARHGPTTRIVVQQPGRCDVRPRTVAVPWGSSDVRVVLPRALTLALTVVTEDGAPVEEFAVVCRPVELRPQDPIGWARQRGHHPGGRLGVEGVRRGANWLRVLPQSEALSPSDAIPFRAADGQTAPMQIVLARRSACRVRVVDSGGAPVPAATVQLVRTGQFGPAYGAGAVDPRADIEVAMPDRPRNEQVSVATTDADGGCRLWLDRGRGDLVLQVRSDGHPPLTLRTPPLVSGGEPLLVRLDASGRIAGRIDLRGVDRQSLQVWCARADATEAMELLLLQPDGSFLSPPLPVGGYRVTLTECVVFEQFGGSETSNVPIPELEQRVQLASGATTTLQFVAPVRRPAMLRGRLLVDGAVPTGLHVELVLQRQGAHGARRGPFAIGADGGFVVTDLLPGTWQLAIGLGIAGTLPPAVQTDTITLGEGEVIERSFAVTRRRLTLHLQDRDGRAVIGAVQLRVGGLSATIGSTDGSLVFDPAPMLPIELARDGRGGSSNATAGWSVPVSMPQDCTEAEVRVVLPMQ